MNATSGLASAPMGPVARSTSERAWKRRSRRLLVTTKIEENAMAAPAISGFKTPATASGMAATL